MEMKIKIKLNFWDSTNDNVDVDIGTVGREGNSDFPSLHSLPPSLPPSYSISFHLILYHPTILKYAPSSSSSSSSSVSVIRSAAKA